MRIILSLLSVVVLAGCTAPNAVNGNNFAISAGLEDARANCLELLRPFIPAGTPNVESKLVQLPDTAAGQKLLRLPIAYGATATKVDARCQYEVTDSGGWRLQRLTFAPRYMADPVK